MPSASIQEVEYRANPHHRDNNPNKSQWLISVSEEEGVFRASYSKEWISNNAVWGLQKSEDGGLKRLGYRDTKEIKLFVAKYVSSEEPVFWHGYPVDLKSFHDRPGSDLLKIWLVNKVLKGSKIRKIQKGQKCAL